ncbi:MAG: hypothetical protein Q9167_004369 [Letrouitia subvulpina]
MADVEMPDAGPSAPKTKAGGSSKGAQGGTSDEGKKRFEVKKASLQSVLQRALAPAEVVGRPLSLRDESVFIYFCSNDAMMEIQTG